MTKYADLFAALAAPFESFEVKVRPAQGGRELHYITARTAMNRLDTVLGPENWWDDYTPLEHSVICRLTLRLPDGETVTKCDAGGYAGMQDQGDDDKSGYSDGFKRAAAKWLVGRYLYRDGVPFFVSERFPGLAALPARAEPARSAPPDHHDGARNDGGRSGSGNGAPPRTGRALFAWIKKQEQESDIHLLHYINDWGKKQNFPEKIIDWFEEQVKAAHAEAVRKLETFGSSGK